MAKVRVPFFYEDCTQTELQEKLKLFKVWANDTVTNDFKLSLEKRLEVLIKDEEKENPISWFQSRYNRAKNLAKRELLRSLIKDLSL